MDPAPPSLIAARCFAAEQATIDDAQAKRDAKTAKQEGFVDEHPGVDGLPGDAATAR